jgi:nitrate reductase NapD
MEKPSLLGRRDLFVLKPATNAEARVHIASLLVHATPDACAAIKQLLQDAPGIELHETQNVGKLALLLESANDRAIADTAARVQEIAGVIGVSVIAHFVETERNLQEDYAGG